MDGLKQNGKNSMKENSHADAVHSTHTIYSLILNTSVGKR